MERRRRRPCSTAPIIIEDDVWLGEGVTILKGVTIGARSVIAAGSVVTKNIGSDTLAGGMPARPIRPVNGRNVA
nr:DapH/DapD/GlmU-related protein [Mesorhizobium sp. LMG 17147]